MRVVKTTDNKHLGVTLASLNKGDVLDLEGFLFEVQEVKVLESGNTLFSNPNYQIECEEL